MSIRRRDDDEWPSKTWVTPADRLIKEVGGDWKKMSEVAAMLGTSDSTLRRLMRGKKVKAPSNQVSRGDLKVYLYSPEDIEEVRAYLTANPEKREP